MKYDAGKRRPALFKKQKHRIPFLPVSLLALVAIILLFSLISPIQFITNINPANVRVPPPTPTPTPLPRPTDVHGGHIVFTCTRKDINQICLISADGTGFRQLTQETTNTYYPAISPDGETVVYASNKYDNFDLYQLNLSNSKTTQLTDNIGNLFSPDFSPDGRQILFVNRVGDGPSSLWVMGSKGEKPHLLYTGPKDIVGAAWSPSGNMIAFAMSVDLPYTYEIFLLDAQNTKTQPHQLTHELSGIGGSLDWSPNETNLLIFAGPVAAREVYKLDIGTGKTTQLTFGGNNASASYSPDGQFIVYNSLRNNNQADLYIMRADGHSTRQLTSFPEPDWQPQWGP
jgi:Tol biopolymer transport system component